MLRKTASQLTTALMLVACWGCLTPGPDAGDLETLPSQAIKDQKEKTLDDQLAEVAERVPAFGGMFFDEANNLCVYLLDATQEKAAEAAIAALFGADYIPPSGLRVLKGQYGFSQLKQWHDHMTGPVLAIPGVILTDIEEAKNRLKIGIEKRAITSQVEKKLVQLKIPRKAVIIEETQPIKKLK